jgi:hypothetical protein
MDKNQLQKSSKLIAQYKGIDEAAALNMLKRKINRMSGLEAEPTNEYQDEAMRKNPMEGIGNEPIENEQVEQMPKNPYGIPDYNKIETNFLNNAQLIAQKKNIPLVQAEQLLQSKMDEISQRKQLEAEETKQKLEEIKYNASDRKGFLENVGDYATETVKHPLDRAGQLGAEVVSALPGLVDVGSAIGSTMINMGHAGAPEEHDITGRQSIKKGDYEGANSNLYGKVHKFAEDSLKSIGLEPPESKFANKANALVSVIPEMALYGGTGTLLKKGAQNVSKLGKAGEKVGKVIDKTGDFLKAGSDIRNPVDLGSNIGGTILPIASGVSSPAASVVLSALGSLGGGKVARGLSNYSAAARKFKNSIKEGDALKDAGQTKEMFEEGGLHNETPEHLSEAGKKQKLYEEAGVPVYPVNLTENKGIKILGKQAEHSIFGGDVRDKLDKQLQTVSEKITPLHAEEFNASTHGNEAIAAYEHNTKKLQEQIDKDFKRTKKSVKEHTDQIVPLVKTKEFIKDFFEDVTARPGHIKLRMDTPAGKFLNLIVAEEVRNNVEKIVKGKQKADFLSPKEKKDLGEILKKNQEPISIKGASGNSHIVDDPLLLEIIRKKIGGESLVDNPLIAPYLNMEYPYVKDAMQYLRSLYPTGKGFTTADLGELRNLYGHMWEDVEASVGKQMKMKSPGDYQHFRDTYRDYVDFLTTERKQRNELLRDVEDPVEFTRQLTNSARNSDGRKVGFITDGMNEGQHQRFIETTNRIMGNNNKKEFNPLTWHNRYKGLDIESKRAIYGDKLPIYDNLSKVVEDMQHVHKLENTSGSSKHGLVSVDAALLYNAFKGLMLGAKTGSISTMGKAVAPILVKITGNRALTNAKVGKWMVMYENAKTKRKMIDAINEIVPHTKSKAIRDMLKNIGRVMHTVEDNE